MMRLGLLGYPVEHSLSPRLHRAALDASGMPGEYSLYPIHPDDMLALAARVNCVRTGEMNGLNVTIPHKQNVLHFLDGLTARARAIGAVNTIYLRDGRVLG